MPELTFGPKERVRRPDAELMLFLFSAQRNAHELDKALRDRGEENRELFKRPYRGEDELLAQGKAGKVKEATPKRMETLIEWVSNGSGYATELPSYALKTEPKQGETEQIFTLNAIYIEKYGIFSPVYWTGVVVR